MRVGQGRWALPCLRVGGGEGARLRPLLLPVRVFPSTLSWAGEGKEEMPSVSPVFFLLFSFFVLFCTLLLLGRVDSPVLGCAVCVSLALVGLFLE